MTFQKYIFVALILFFVGIASLFSGINRAPFRQNNPDMEYQHGHSSWLIQPSEVENSEHQILAFK